MVVGLYAVQRPRIGRLGLYGALAYAYSFMFFASTVVYAPAAGSRNWTAVTSVFGGWLTLHGAIMVIGGIAFGLAVIKTAVLPRWTGACRRATDRCTMLLTLQPPRRTTRSERYGQPRRAAGACARTAGQRAVIKGIFAMSAAQQTRGRLNMQPPS